MKKIMLSFLIRAIYVADAKSATRAGMYIDDKGRGVLYADVKNFAVDHPEHPGEQIICASPGRSRSAYL